MPDSYSSSLKLTLLADGDTNWGTTVNNGVTALIDSSIAGTSTITLSSTTDRTLTDINGTADEARNMFIRVIGTPGGTTNVICPSVSKLYFFTNATTGGYSVVLKTSAGAGVSVPNGDSAVLYCNGTAVVPAIISTGKAFQ